MALLALFYFGIIAKGDEYNWTRDLIQDSTNAEARNKPFHVAVAAATDSKLEGLCTYDPRRSIPPIVLHGKIDIKGQLWPVVSYELRTGTDQWRQVARRTESTNALVIKRDNGPVRLNVDMEPFRGFIGRSRWGRVVLENGDAAVVDLDDFLPPCNVVQQGHDCKEVFDVRHPIQGSEAFLYSVILLQNHVTGVFVDMRERESTLKGSTNRDGDFSPSAEFYVAKANGQWTPIGTSTPLEQLSSICVSRKPAVFRIDLDIYKPVVGRFRLGKAVFSDGSSAVFRLCELEPLCSE
jgi:hypothetical protein